MSKQWHTGRQDKQGIPIPTTAAGAQQPGAMQGSAAQQQFAASGSLAAMSGFNAPPNSLAAGAGHGAPFGDAGQGTPLSQFHFGSDFSVSRNIAPGIGAPPNSFATQPLAAPYAAPGISGSVISRRLHGIKDVNEDDVRDVNEDDADDKEAMAQSPEDNAVLGGPPAHQESGDMFEME